MSGPAVPNPPIILRYDRQILLLDGLRALAGICACFGPILFLSPVPWIAWGLGALGGLFLWFAARTILKARVAIQLEGTVISVTGLTERRVDLARLSVMKLSYFGKRGTSDTGTMSMILGDGGQSLRLDSHLDRFDEIVAIAVAQARRTSMSVDPTTLHNLSVLGHRLEDA